MLLRSLIRSVVGMIPDLPRVRTDCRISSNDCGSSRERLLNVSKTARACSALSVIARNEDITFSFPATTSATCLKNAAVTNPAKSPFKDVTADPTSCQDFLAFSPERSIFRADLSACLSAPLIPD